MTYNDSVSGEQGNRAALVRAIRERKKVQLGYKRLDGSVSLHTVAPLDIRQGETAKTERSDYLWAYCFAEGRLESHILTRVLTVLVRAETFASREILALCPPSWDAPRDWSVHRKWQ
jgi:hypothetical protein